VPQMTSALPRDYWMDEHGEWTIKGITQQFSRLWDIAERVAPLWYAASDDEVELQMNVAEGLQLTAEVISANYRVSPFEIGHILQLLNDQANGDVMAALLDFEGYVEILKKNRQCDTSSTQTGETVDRQDIVQPLQT